MADTLPWEDFAQTNTAVESPPWEDFAQPKAKKTRAQVMASIPQGDTEQLSGLEKVANAAYWPTRILSRIDPVTAITDALSVGTGENQFQRPTIPPEVVKSGMEMMVPRGSQPTGFGEGVQDFVSQLVSGMSSPHAVAGMASGKINPMLPVTTFAPPMVADIPQATQALVGSQTPQETTSNLLRVLLNVLGPIGMAKGVGAEAQPSELGYSDIPGPRMEDLPGAQEVAPANRQLPLTTATRLAELNNPTPNVILPVEGQGRPVYQVPAQRQPVALLPEKSDYTRLLEEEALSAAQVAQNPPIRSDIASQRPVDPSTMLLGREQGVRYFSGPSVNRGLLLPENTYQGPTDVNPTGGATFVTDPAARTLPMEQFSPMEQREAMRGPREYSPREESVRPSQEGPTILGQDKMPWEVYYEQQKQPLEQPIVPSKPPVEPSGGEISFRGEGVPSARQGSEMLPGKAKAPVEVPKTEAPVVESQTSTKPEVVKMGSSKIKGPLGDPLGTTYRATQEDFNAYQAAQSGLKELLSKGGEIGGPEMVELMRRNETIKNKYGGMPPEAPANYEQSSKSPNASSSQSTEQKESTDVQRLPENPKLAQFAEQLSARVDQEVAKMTQGVPQDLKHGDVVKVENAKFPHREYKVLGTYRAGQRQRYPGEIMIRVEDITKGDVQEGAVGDYRMADLRLKEPGETSKLPGSISSEAKGMQTKLKPGQGGQAGSIVNPISLLKPAAEKAQEVGKKLGEYFKGAADKALPALNFDTKSPLPDLQPKEIANKIWSQPFASEKMPVLGRLLGGKARIRTPQDEAIATWYAERHGVGPAIASNVGEQIRGQITSAFKVSENGDLNVGRTEGPKQSLKMSDVFETLRKNPSAYKLTPGQAQVFNKIIEPLTKRITQLAQKYDLIDEMVDESGDFKPYFPRIVTEHPKVQPEKGTSAFQKRAFSTEKEGWERGYKYETNPEKRLVSGVERLYRAIANQRLAKDPILGAKSEGQVKAEIQEAFAEELGSGEMSQAKIDRIAEGIRTKGQVMQPILIRKIFDPEVAKTLNREFAAEQSNVMKAIADTNSLLKATQLGFDLGVGQIQMLPMLYNNPKIWAQAQFKSLQSMASPKFFSEYARQNKEVISELAQMGSGVGRLQEMMAGLGEGQLLSKVPVVGPVGEAFGRQFQTALDVAKVEMWKALRETAPKSEWPKLVRGIETSLLSGRMESAMVPHGRALLERIALLAPSYYRGAVDSIAGLAEQGAGGKVIRQTMGRFILGGLLTYYAAAKMAGMKDDEIKKRLDPTRSDYLNVAVKQDDGSVVNVGFGGIHRSLLRLAANTVKTSVEHPENWKSLSAEKNPLSRWYRGHAGPTVALTWEGVTGKDFLGRNSDIASMGTRAIPLIAQQAIPQKGEAKAKPIEYVASALGMTATPESYTSRRNRVETEISQQKTGKDFSELSLGQRRGVEKETNKKLAGVPTGLTEERSQELAMKKSNERLENVRKGLREDTQKWIEEGGVKLRNYETSKELGKITVHLTKEETDFLHKQIVEEYQKVFDRLQSNARINALPTSDKQRYVDVNLENARARAWNKTRRSVGKLPQEQ